MEYLHDAGIMHRDIKPENIYITNSGSIKLLDFGFAAFLGPLESRKESCGTFAYAAPELVVTKVYSKQVDMWSVGVVAYLMLRGRLPFDDSNP